MTQAANAPEGFKEWRCRASACRARCGSSRRNGRAARNCTSRTSYCPELKQLIMSLIAAAHSDNALLILRVSPQPAKALLPMPQHPVACSQQRPGLVPQGLLPVYVNCPPSELAPAPVWPLCPAWLRSRRGPASPPLVLQVHALNALSQDDRLMEKWCLGRVCLRTRSASKQQWS